MAAPTLAGGLRESVPPGGASLALREGEVHLWRAPLDPSEPDPRDIEGLLSADELARARAFHRPADGRRYAAGRTYLRRLLGCYLDTDPRALRFAYTRQGRPTLRGEGHGWLAFSVAHSAGEALIGLTRGGRLGVDLELVRDLDVLGLARRFFAPEELRALRALPDADRPAAFFRCWTRKEAYLKARGDGLAAPLDAFAVSVADDGPRALSWSTLDPADPLRFLFAEPAAPDGFAATVAVEAPPACESPAPPRA